MECLDSKVQSFKSCFPCNTVAFLFLSTLVFETNKSGRWLEIVVPEVNLCLFRSSQFDIDVQFVVAKVQMGVNMQSSASFLILCS